MSKVLLLIVLVTASSVVACPTWFIEKNGTCECGSDLGGAIMCNNYTKTVAIVDGYCISYNINATLSTFEDSKLVAGFCFTRYNYAGIVNRVYHTLDSNKVKGRCTNFHLKGFFCGECEKGYGLAINSMHMECVNNCNRWDVSKALTCLILPITVFFLAVLLFRPNFPSGHMLGYILYCQGFIVAMKYNVGFYTSILGNLHVHGLQKVALKCSLGLSGIWWYFATLLFCIPHQCFSTGMSYNINGTSLQNVLVHEPSIVGFSPQHLPYAIPAILLLFFLGVCPTLFLCLYPIRVFRKCFYRCTTPRFQLSVNFFIETFQNCYKDGLNGTYDFRFLSSAPLLLFLSFVLLGTIPGTTEFNSCIYIAGCISLVFIILAIIVSYVRPFKSLYDNFSFTFHSAVFSFMTVVGIIWYEGHFMSAHSLATLFTCLSLLPHIFALATLVYHILRRIRFFRTKCERLSEIISAKFRQSQTDIAESLPDRLQNSSAYKTLSVMH